MSSLRFAIILLWIAVLLPLNACTEDGSKQKETVFKKVPEIRDIKPHKPVNIKLKRNAKGGYSWDLSGGNADKIIEADKKLREYIKK